MGGLWGDALASLTGDAGAQARVTSTAKGVISTYDAMRSLVGSGKASAQAVAPAPTATAASSSLTSGGFSMVQIGVGLSAAAVVLWLALRGR